MTSSYLSTVVLMKENENFLSFPCQDMLSRCFHFGVFEIFVSSLFLLVIWAFGEYWYSVLYIPKVDSQEEDHDGGRVPVPFWLCQSPPTNTDISSLIRGCLSCSTLYFQRQIITCLRLMRVVKCNCPQQFGKIEFRRTIAKKWLSPLLLCGIIS